jgi:hypothetical protein
MDCVTMANAIKGVQDALKENGEKGAHAQIAERIGVSKKEVSISLGTLKLPGAALPYEPCR